MRWSPALVLLLCACGKEPTLGEQQRAEAPARKPAEPASAAGSGAGSAAPAPASAKWPASKLGTYGLRLVGDKAGDGPHWFRCEGAPLCDGPFAYDPATRTAKLVVEADPDVELWVPGATLGNGAAWKIDLLDLLGRIRVDGKLGKPEHEVRVEVHRKDGLETEVKLTLDLSGLADEAFASVAAGKRLAFPQDAISKFPADAVLRMTRLDTGTTLDAVAPAAALGEVDFLAVEKHASHVGSSCTYVDPDGQRVVKARRIADRDVTIYARRTGGIVARRVLQGATPPCPEKLWSGDEIFGAVSDEEIEKFVMSFVRPRGGEPDLALPKLPAPGRQLSPEEGGEVPSRWPAIASKLGITDPSDNNDDDTLDTLSGSLGDDFVALLELRKPKAPKGGSAAAAFKGDYGVAVVLRDNPDPAAAQQLLDLALAKAPDVAAMLSSRLPGYHANTEKLDAKRPALTSRYHGDRLGAGTTHVLRKVGDRIACRTRTDRMTCAVIEILGYQSKATADKLLAKLP